jgi:Family of unknown function (DUF5372)
VTHPFHPLFGREFQLVTYRQNWGEDRVYFHDDTGQLVALPARWTSVFPSDPFAVLSAGRSPFCFAQLLELARMIQQSHSVRPAEDQGG